jgi:hypothetical protein
MYLLPEMVFNEQAVTTRLLSAASVLLVAAPAVLCSYGGVVTLVMWD